MTTYDDPEVNALESRITLVSDPGVPTLSAVIEAETEYGRVHVREQRMTAQDYAYDGPTLSALLRRIGREQNVPMAVFDRLEAFVARLPNAPIDEVLGAFAMLHPQRAAA
jgi:hypothetical protein